jgi:polyisoprenoid-binding protein YceI
MRSRGLLLLSLSALWGGAALSAENWNVRIDAKASALDFSVGATMHTVRGKARFEGGELVYDPATGEASGEVVVDARSFDTANSGRDQKMHSTVLESVKFPRVVFKPRRIEGAVPGTVKISGTFQIHGVEQSLEVPGEVTRVGDRLTVATSFSVPFVRWGLTDPSGLLRVDKEVAVRVKLVGDVRSAPSPSP